MIDGNFSSQDSQAHLLQVKKNFFGSVQNVSSEELSEIEYLEIEIKESTALRKTNSMPFFAIGVVILVFSATGTTLVTSSIGMLMGLLSLGVATRIVIKHTHAIKAMKQKLQMAKGTSK